MCELDAEVKIKKKKQPDGIIPLIWSHTSFMFISIA